MGRLLIDSIFHRDYTMIQAIVVVITLMVLVMNLLVDVAYGWLDPRSATGRLLLPILSRRGDAHRAG